MAKRLEDNVELRDGVFRIIGEHPKYRVQLCEDLLGYKDLKPEDVQVVTLSKKTGYGMENDVGLLCKGMTLWMGEANTTPPYNMPVRMFLYVSVTYRNYLLGKGFNIRDLDPETGKELLLPGVQAYVVYPYKSEKYNGSMWLHDYLTQPNSLDLEVKVLNKGHEGSQVIKDYISVCDLVTEARKQGKRDIELGQWVREQCMKRDLFSDIMGDPKLGIMKELSTMATVREIREAGRIEGVIEGDKRATDRERALFYRVLSEQLGMSIEEAQEFYLTQYVNTENDVSSVVSTDVNYGGSGLNPMHL